MSSGLAPSRAFFARSAALVAPELVGMVLVAGQSSARIVEVEAYDPDDPASHSFIGERPRNRVMFERPGHLYVYRSYGLHWCANVVCGPVGVGAAVLLRAGEPTAGEESMWSRRPLAKTDRQLCGGPGRLCAALGIDGTDNGVDLLDPAAGLRLETAPPNRAVTALVRTVRVGITKAAAEPLRWYEEDSVYVSRRTRPDPRPASS